MNFLDTLISTLLQLAILGVIGGGISLYYTNLQKKKELKLSIIKDFFAIHAKFIALRYEFNTFHIERGGKRSPKFHLLTKNEIRLQKWELFQKACLLIGDVQSLKVLIVELFPRTSDEVEYVFGIYQEWRRRIHADQPILQNKDGSNDDIFDELQEKYKLIVKAMRKSL